ncbi:MAG: type II toxin-antitoxin system HicB family antitoxin [Deltaproteobacteria bacterium]|nr:type II toxin-antitoxin system HicB family antitoxin [Deltaproteobacteria bacterium]
MKPIIKFEIKVPFKIFPENEEFVSYCPTLDVSSQGSTPEEAKENLIEALTGFIITCYEMGTLSAVLKECGFTHKPATHIAEYEDNEDFLDIPLPFIIDNPNNHECHA